jgi:centractin
VIEVGRARFRAPEVLFQPHLIGEESEGIHNVATIIISVVLYV